MHIFQAKSNFFYFHTMQVPSVTTNVNENFIAPTQQLILSTTTAIEPIHEVVQQVIYLLLNFLYNIISI